MVNTKQAVFLFTGSDDYSKDKAIRNLRESLLDSSSRELDYKVFNSAETSAYEILEYVMTVPFLAEKRFVVVRDFEELADEDRERIANYAKNPSRSTCLVIETKDDSIIRKYPLLADRAAVTRFGPLSFAQFQSWVKDKLSSWNVTKKITPDAVKVLFELCGSDLNLAEQELGKVVSFALSRDELTIADIDEVAGKDLNAFAFDLTDAIDKGDVKEALSIISDLMRSGKKHYEVIGILCWQMKRILRAKMMLLKGLNEAGVAGILKINSYYSERFFKTLKTLDIIQIKARMRAILEADLDIKRSKYDPLLRLEFCVIKLCLGALR